ncbi:MAG: helix-turn-helix domain-containing protein [Bacillota bacterium]
MSVGKRIAEVRKGMCATQEYVAQKLNRTPQWLSNIERGIRPIMADELVIIAEVLGVDPSIFFDNHLNKTLKETQELPKTNGRRY